MMKRGSLLWRILISTSIAITILFVALGWVVQTQLAGIAERTLEEEARASFQAHESLWRARAEQLSQVSLVLSRMPDVRGAFSTGDEATIRDTAREVWDQLSRPESLFLVCDPQGVVIASVAGPKQLRQVQAVVEAAPNFPQQARGFVNFGEGLYQIVITPVYVAATQGEALLNVLVAGIAVDNELASELGVATGSSFEFIVQGKRVATSTAGKVKDGGYSVTFSSALADPRGRPVGELRIVRGSFEAMQRISDMRWRLVFLWIAAIAACIGLTYLFARRMLHPVGKLDQAAAEIAKGNYTVRVEQSGDDEIARLGATFNGMCASLTKARDDLIRQERISTIGRLAASIIHDLRNPLAAIYGGSEMLVDGKLSSPQVQRLSTNIYNASRQVQTLLQELADVTQGRGQAPEVCRLREVVAAAHETLSPAAEASGVKVNIEVADELELPLNRSPMERVFQNLIGNAIEAMPQGGSVSVSARQQDGEVLVRVEDTGPGVPDAIANQLFEPFVTAGKKNGIGLGLALSRKTVLAHGGDLWAEGSSGGACFVMRLPNGNA